MAKRILIVEVNWLGDVLFSTPFIRAVRNNFPNAYIACMTLPGCKEVLEGNPNINEIIIYDEKGACRGLAGKIKFIRKLKGYNFDTAFLLHRSFTRTLLVYLAGIGERIGYYTAKRALFLTKKPRPPKEDLHRAEFYLNLLKAAGLKTDENGCEFFISQKDSDWASDFLKNNGIKSGHKVIIFNPGGNWIPKRWPKVYFAALGKKILAHFGNDVKILLTGSEKDLPLAEHIRRQTQPEVIIACAKATLKQTAALFKKADLVVSSDSGPLHIAVSVGAKTVGLFGPTSPGITGPYKADDKKVIVLRKDIGCRIPCYEANCGYSGCMAAITPDEVFEAAKKLL